MRGNGLSRRSMLAGSAAAALWPQPSRAQSIDRVRRIGVLMGRHETDTDGQKQLAALRQGLRDLGWKLGRSIEIESRWTGGDAAKALRDARELIAMKPDLLVANTTPSLRALREVANATPIVFSSVADPLGQGFVPSLARPGGNITGFSAEEASMGGKWLDYLREAAPRVGHVAIVFNPNTAPYAAAFMPSLEAGGRAMKISLAPSPARNPADIERAVAQAAAKPNAGLIALPDSFLIAQRTPLLSHLARHRMPAIFPNVLFATDGGLIAYGIDRVDMFRRSADYVDRILKGAKPGDLPVQQPTKFDLAINLKTAKTLGLTIPQSLLLSADDVIE